MVYRNKKIKFIKPKLDKLQWTGKREWYSAENIEGLCIQVNKSSKTYYAQWSNPKIPIFDEATNALDLKTEELVMSSIKKLQAEKIIIIISHKKITLGFCSSVIELKNGELKELS